jgi:hypothetical protein
MFCASARTLTARAKTLLFSFGLEVVCTDRAPVSNKAPLYEDIPAARRLAPSRPPYGRPRRRKAARGGDIFI